MLTLARRESIRLIHDPYGTMVLDAVHPLGFDQDADVLNRFQPRTVRGVFAAAG
ncbi:MAG TPA: hypothetical protein VMV35_03385 [Halothiobacillus sp.]|nr:hypothetical protein [Halothiobacillus sp.]